MEELAKCSPDQETLLTIGVFDGIHLGHQHLIEELKKQASQRHLLSGVITFYRHPSVVLSPQTRLPYLTNIGERAALIKSLSIELIVALSFTREVADLTARQFLSLMQRQLRMRGLVVGPDFALGRRREGNVATLRSLGQEMGFTVDAVSPMLLEGEVVSSTAIRQALQKGDMGKAAKLLGRPFSLEGKVVPGVARGRSLGFPTANVEIDPERALPADGVYVVRANIDGTTYRGVANIGKRPTFENGERTVEVHLLDFGGDLYQRQIRVEFRERVRGEMRFASVEELKAQIAKDVEQAKALLQE